MSLSLFKKRTESTRDRDVIDYPISNMFGTLLNSRIGEPLVLLVEMPDWSIFEALPGEASAEETKSSIIYKKRGMLKAVEPGDIPTQVEFMYIAMGENSL